MSFFNKPPGDRRDTNYERAIKMLEDRKIDLGRDTKEKDGRFFILDMEVNEEEYNKFLDQYNQIMEHEIEDLKQAA